MRFEELSREIKHYLVNEVHLTKESFNSSVEKNQKAYVAIAEAHIQMAAAVAGAIEELQPVEEIAKKRGRPKVIKDGKTLSFWVDQDTIEDLQHFAKRYNLTVSALIRLFLSAGLESCHQKEEKENAAPAPADPEPTNEETPAQVVVEIPKVNISTVRHF